MITKKQNRRGAIAALICVSLVPLMGLFALAVDYGFLLKVRTDLQRAADSAVLAAVRELVPDKYGIQDFEKTRQTVRDFVQHNLGSDFIVNDEDIEIGRYNPNNIYQTVQLLDSGIRDAVRVTIKRDDLTNGSVFLYFAQMFDKKNSGIAVTATAVLQKGRFFGPGTDILPIAISTEAWQGVNLGDSFSVYGDGRLVDSGGTQIAGNWGTVDIGSKSNSTADLDAQIRNGIRQSDLDAMYSDGIITTSEHIDSLEVILPNGDTGFSAGIKNPIDEEMGNTKLVPIYESTTSKGGSMYFTIVGWGGVTLDSSRWQGSKNSRLTVTRTFLYDKDIIPNPDLGETDDILDAVYTSPTLVE